MEPPILVRPLTDAERTRLEAGLHSSDVFVLRRCQMLLASARGEWPSQIARTVGRNHQTVRNVIRQFEQEGLDRGLTRQSHRPHHPPSKRDPAATERLCDLLHESPRRFGKPASCWTLELAAAVSCEQGLTAERVSDETIRVAFKRLGVGWQRAKHWITSADPGYARKKAARPPDPLGRAASRQGAGL